MRVVFVMPNAGSIPIGGFKVVYEYANHLTRRGHTVTVVHSALQRVDTPLPELPRRIAHYWRVRLSGKVGPAGWFGLDPNVSLRWVLRPDDRHVPDADAVIATSWDVAEWVQRYPGTKGNRFYFIQHLESWDGPEDRVLATWRLPLRKIVIARWLQEIGTGQGVDAAYIPNGLDFDAFGVDIEPADRNPLQYAMLFHTSAWKGCADGLAAFSIIRRRFPTTELELFGVADPPANLPAGVTYRKQPSPKELRALYNRCAIFLAPSHTEGWGLTATEAMVCGAALVATDIGGHREFAIPDQTALCSPAKCPEKLAANAIRLIEDAPLRVSLAQAGQNFVQQFTWERATNALERTLLRG